MKRKLVIITRGLISIRGQGRLLQEVTCRLKEPISLRKRWAEFGQKALSCMGSAAFEEYVVCSPEEGLRVSAGTERGEGFIVSAMGKPPTGLCGNGIGCAFTTHILPTSGGG